MHAVLAPTNSLAETFREPDHAYLSPRRVGRALGLQIQSVAERARSVATPQQRARRMKICNTICVKSCVSWQQQSAWQMVTATKPSSGL